MCGLQSLQGLHGLLGLVKLLAQPKKRVENWHIFGYNRIVAYIWREKMRKFTLEYWEDNGWYVGRLKEVPGVFSQGETLKELEENIRDAYHLILESQKKVELKNVEIKEEEIAV